MKKKEAFNVLDEYFSCHDGIHVHSEAWNTIRKDFEESQKTPPNTTHEEICPFCGGEWPTCN